MKQLLTKSSFPMFFAYSALAGVITLILLTTGLHSTDLENVFVFFFKLMPFVLAVFAIGVFPAEKLNKPLKLILGMLTFAVIWCFFVPKQIWFFIQNDWDQYYMMNQIYVTFIILSLSFLYRLGGGKAKDVIFMGITLLIFLISGIEDLAVILVNGQDMPDFWEWPKHIIVRIGKVPSKYEAFAFIAGHMALIGALFFFVYGKKSPFNKTKNNKMKKSA